jgi:hypothetical protein
LSSDPDAYRYRPDVLDELSRHGVRPTGRSRPELVRGFVRDLYCYEIRVLREQLRRREFPRTEYADRVAALRNRYRVLSLLPREFVE